MAEDYTDSGEQIQHFNGHVSHGVLNPLSLPGIAPVVTLSDPAAVPKMATGPRAWKPTRRADPLQAWCENTEPWGGACAVAQSCEAATPCGCTAVSVLRGCLALFPSAGPLLLWYARCWSRACKSVEQRWCSSWSTAWIHKCTEIIVVFEYCLQDDPDSYSIKHSALARRLVRGLGVTRKGVATKATLSTLREVEAGPKGGRQSRFQ